MKGSIIINVLEYFFPPRCAICNKLLQVGVPIYICENCIEEIGYYNNYINPLNLPRDLENYCDGMVCVGRYSSTLKNSLKRFKFSSKPSYYQAFGRLLALKVENTEQVDTIDMIIPVPLHRNKYKQRGYNQAELISKYVAKILKIPYASNILIKSLETKSQSMLTRNERLLNVEGSFQVKNERVVLNKKVLLVDDIITTGSTVNQCCKVLKHAGAKNVIVGVIATTRGNIQ